MLSASSDFEQQLCVVPKAPEASEEAVHIYDSFFRLAPNDVIREQNRRRSHSETLRNISSVHASISICFGRIILNHDSNRKMIHWSIGIKPIRATGMRSIRSEYAQRFR